MEKITALLYDHAMAHGFSTECFEMLMQNTEAVVGERTTHLAFFNAHARVDNVLLYEDL